MRVLVLGAAGRMGSEAMRDLAGSRAVSKVVAADVRKEKTQTRVGALATKERRKVEVRAVDLNDDRSLIKLMRGADVVVNCVGPFYRYGVKAVKAALEARTHYVDICDDYDATKEMLKLDKLARGKGVLILTGLGLSPGITNVMARYGVERMDRAEEVHTSWVVGVADPSGFGALCHGLHMISGKIPQYIDGKWVEVPAMSGTTCIDMPQPLGRCEVYYVGHSEPVTIPRFMKGLKTVTNKGGLYPAWANQHSRDRIALGLDRLEPVMVDGKPVVPRDFAIALDRAVLTARKAEGLIEFGQPYSALRVDVKGEKAGKKVQYSYYGIAALAKATGIAASIGGIMIGHGDIKATGVVAPEAVVSPRAFVTEYSKRGLELYASEEHVL